MIPEELDPFGLFGHAPQDALPSTLDAYLLMELSNNLGDEADGEEEGEQEDQ
jgi:hypothetical protein